MSLNNQKLKRANIFICVLGIVVSILFLSLTVLYFFQNYGSIRVYKIYADSEKYQILNGLLILSKEKIYFDLGEIIPNVNEIEIYCEEENEKKLVYKGSPTNILNDLYGYNNMISYEKFIEGKQNIYLKINEDELKLNFIEDFLNDNFWYRKLEDIGELTENKYEVEIPIKIEKEFNCSNNFCVLEKKDEIITFNNNILLVTNKYTNKFYDLSNKIFTYEANIGNENETVFTLENDILVCSSGTCDNAYKIFSDFTTNYINKYLN